MWLLILLKKEAVIHILFVQISNTSMLQFTGITIVQMIVPWKTADVAFTITPECGLSGVWFSKS